MSNKHRERALAALKGCGSHLDQVNAVAEALAEVERETLERTIALLMEYSDEDGEVTEGRGIVAAIRALTNE